MRRLHCAEYIIIIVTLPPHTKFSLSEVDQHSCELRIYAYDLRPYVKLIYSHIRVSDAVTFMGFISTVTKIIIIIIYGYVPYRVPPKKLMFRFYPPRSPPCFLFGDALSFMCITLRKSIISVHPFP